MPDHDFEHSRTAERLQEFEHRLSRLETHLGLSAAAAATQAAGLETAGIQPPVTGILQEFEAKSGFEARLGELGLAWAGGAILLLGVAFSMAYIQGLGYPAVASALGFLAAGVFYFIARVNRESAATLSGTMVGAGLILLYYATLKLHFFSAEPLVKNAIPVLVALVLVVAFQLYVALKRNSESIAMLAAVLGLALGLFSDTTRIGLPFLVIVAAVAVQLAMRRDWWMLLGMTMIGTYASHLIWLLSNPVMGHPMGAIARDQYSLVLLLFCAAVYCWPPLVRDTTVDFSAMTVILFNSLGLSVLAALTVYAIYQKEFAAVGLACAVFFLAASVLQWLKSRQQLASSFYVCFGFLALSVALYGYAGIPAVFLWLCLQSLLVVSMALWFRSRFLVVVNAFIFVGILAIYVTNYPSSDWVNFSFALVGHASARIINWQKTRLTLRTEMLRNVYLGIGFVFVLYGLYHAVPSQYVTLSWTGAAVTYFLVSLLLKNIKYRWLAINSLLATIINLLTLDMARLDAKYRFPAFLVVGVASLVISLYYARSRRRQDNKGE